MLQMDKRGGIILHNGQNRGVCYTMDKTVVGYVDGGDIKRGTGYVMGVERDKCFLICTNEKDALSLRRYSSMMPWLRIFDAGEDVHAPSRVMS